MADKYVLAIDQGTTSSRAIVFDHAGQAEVMKRSHYYLYLAPGRKLEILGWRYRVVDRNARQGSYWRRGIRQD